jgi:NADH:ubiquinone oxidoreductase subunit 5 (subunit L)/multisubunit Na+/H+ antiporter MnhA subunit
VVFDDSDSRKAQLKTINPISLFTIALLLIGVVVIGLGWHSYVFCTNEEAKVERNDRIYQLRSNIQYFHEVLTMSARLAAATGDLQWEERYLEYAPKLDAAFKEAIEIAPEAYDSEMAMMAKTAVIKSADMEKQVFDLVRQGHVDEASALLSSDEYEDQKWTFVHGIAKYARNMAIESRFHELRSSVVNLNEVLGTSVLMAVTTGDLQWEKRYYQYKPQLDVQV